jgi:hypothetical protein
LAGYAAAPALALLHTELSRAISAVASLALRLPPPWAALLAGVGVIFLLHGARRRIVLAFPGGAVIGLVAARVVVTAMDGPGAAVHEEILWISAGVGALLCAGWPPIFPVLALALPGALAGGLLTLAGRAWLGALAGCAVGGGIGALLREWVACLAAGGIGAAAVVAGALGLLARWPLARKPIAVELVEHPMALLAPWAVLTVAGAAFHAGRAWPRDGARGARKVTVEPPDPSPEKAAWDSRGADR